MPTIRIDDEVYQWLQDQAKPFEDTPNTVLRRIAKLESARDDSATEGQDLQAMPQAKKQLSGNMLNKEWNVGAKHALYHRDGHWYNNLQRFPGALFDPNGYVLFATEQEYRDSPYVNVTQETNVQGGIKKMPEYVKMVE